MKNLKPISEQVVVVVGASSGMGRISAIRFARAGAKVVVAARNRAALESLVSQIVAAGGVASLRECDVSDFAQVKALADFAVESYGRIDTWAHFSATALYATFAETTPEEFHRIIHVNLLGQVYGAMAALPHLRANGRGTLIFLSSVESQISIPLTSAYAASKHGMNGFIDALRLELEHEKFGVSVTTVMPTGVNTPFFTNAKTKLGVKPKPPQPIYSPDHVAEVVLYAAEHRVREVFVGGAAKLISLGKRFTPRLMDAYLRATSFTEQRTDEAKSEAAKSGLYAPETDDSRVHGDFVQMEKKASCYVWLQTHPIVWGILKGLGLLLLLGIIEESIRRQCIEDEWT